MKTEYDKRRQLQTEKDMLSHELKLRKEKIKRLEEELLNVSTLTGLEDTGLQLKQVDKNNLEIYEPKLSVKIDCETREITFKDLVYSFKDIINISHYLKEVLLNMEDEKCAK